VRRRVNCRSWQGTAALLLGLAVIIGCVTSACPVLASDADSAKDDRFANAPPDDFFAGEYVLIGQRPADGAAYKGRARIDITDRHGLRLVRRIDGKMQMVDGEFAPGGEARVKSLAFHWRDGGGDEEMFCQYATDFNNYPRLSCLWSRRGETGLPGFESYYPTAALAGIKGIGSKGLGSKSLAIKAPPR